MASWSVYGCDTFSRETYLVKICTSEEEAKQIVDYQQKEAAKTQDVSLRDTFWIEYKQN
jgi:predicted DNA-binding protein (UPF0251 family)